MTDNEIIEALECFAKSGWLNDCDGCPCFDPKKDIQTSECQERLMKYALDLINRQKAEIERLKGTVIRELSDGCKKCQHNSVCNEIENLRRRNEFIWYQAESGCPHFRANDKAEAYKEFAEKMKEKSFKTIRNYGLTKDVVEVCDIDNLVKEMVGDSNE